MNILNCIRNAIETLEWQAHQRILSHDYDRLLAEVEEEQEVFEASPTERRGPVGDRSPEVCGGIPPLQSPSGGRPTSELLQDAAIVIGSWAPDASPGMIAELCERATLLKGMGY